MTPNKTEPTGGRERSGLSTFWLKEDWWAVWLGLGVIILAYIFYLSGSSVSWIAVAPAKWSTFSDLSAQLAKNGVRYLPQCQWHRRQKRSPLCAADPPPFWS